MNILITAGGTTEKIDHVRQLTNHATGRLGAAIVKAFQKVNDCHMTYVHGPQAVIPESNQPITFIPIDSVASLDKTIKQLLAQKKFDAVIHSMAVSDYQLKEAVDQERLTQKISQWLIDQPQTNNKQLAQDLNQWLTTESLSDSLPAKKISSQADQLVLFLAKAPKVIQQIKQLQPDTILIGFKLLVGVSHEQLLQVATESLRKNQADAILANDLEHITADQHQAFLLRSDGQVTTCQTKDQIAQAIVTLIIEKKGV